MSKIYLDEKGYNEYLKEIDAIKEKIKKNSSDITEYQSDDAYGDGWHDNFAYEQARNKENMLFHELEVKLKGLENIEIVKESGNKNEISINSVVSLKFEDSNEIEKYLLTGSTISDTSNEVTSITLNSPLGKTIYKKKINDTFEYSVDDRIIRGTIVNIENSCFF